jgi:hypothetical protein
VGGCVRFDFEFFCLLLFTICRREPHAGEKVRKMQPKAKPARLTPRWGGTVLSSDWSYHIAFQAWKVEAPRPGAASCVNNGVGASHFHPVEQFAQQIFHITAPITLARRCLYITNNTGIFSSPPPTQGYHQYNTKNIEMRSVQKTDNVINNVYYASRYMNIRLLLCVVCLSTYSLVNILILSFFKTNRPVHLRVVCCLSCWKNLFWELPRQATRKESLVPSLCPFNTKYDLKSSHVLER